MMTYIVSQRYFFEEEPAQFIIRDIYDDKSKAQKRIGELYDKEFDFFSKEYGKENIGAFLESNWFEIKSETSSTFCDIVEKELQ